MKIKERSFINLMYPIDYSKQTDYPKILRYQYNITCKTNELLNLKLGQRDAFEKIYNYIRQKDTLSEYTEFVSIDAWAKNDIIYLILKEHLLEYFHTCVNSPSATTRKTFNKKELNKTHNSGHEDEPWRIQENYRTYGYLPHFELLNTPDIITLLESDPTYSVIPYQLIYAANTNPIFCRMHDSPKTIEEISLNAKISNYILANESSSHTGISYNGEYFYIIGEKPFLKIEIDSIFFNAYEYIRQLKQSEFINLVTWEKFSEDDKRILITFLMLFFQELYELRIAGTNQTEPHWEELSKQQKEKYRSSLVETFKKFFVTQRKKQRTERSYTIKYKDYTKYLTSYCESYRKIFNFSDLPKYKLDQLTSYWISETLLPTLTINSLVSNVAFKTLIQNISITYSGSKYKRYFQRLETECLDAIAHLLYKLSLCPNIFNQIIILEHFCQKYKPYSDFYAWYADFDAALNYYNYIYYPVLESSFHLAYSLYQTSEKFEKPKNIHSILPLSFDRKHQELLKGMETLKSSEIPEETYIVEKLYSNYIDMYDSVKNRAYQRLDKFQREEII